MSTKPGRKATLLSSSLSRAVVNSPVGSLEIQWTGQGLRSIRGSDQTAGGDPLPQPIERAIEDFFTGRPVKLNEFDRSEWSDFQTRVYDALIKVPRGSVVTYGELAEASGAPGAARAVGTAMATNKIPFLIPCHRVLPSGARRLGQYTFREGPQLKARLLNFERLQTKTETDSPWWEFDWGEASKRLASVLPITKRAPFLSTRLKSAESLFATLGRAIVGQQIHPKAAASIWQRLQKFETSQQIARASLAELRECGLSERKAESIQQLARACEDRTIPDLGQAYFMSNEALIEALTQIKGIGQWQLKCF